MKRFFALLLTMLLFVQLSFVAFAVNETEDTVSDEFITISGEITPEEKAILINSAELHPLTTGYPDLDNLVQDIFSDIFTPEMSLYQKVCACYLYLMTDTQYINDNATTDYLYYNLWKTINYKHDMDRNIVCEAYGMLVEKKGVCNHFSSAFLVMTRALGLESYIVTCGNSTIRGTGSHYGTMIKLQGKYYLFDPVMGVVWQKTDEVENSGYFCTPLASTPEREYCNHSELLDDFGCFETVSNPTSPLNEVYTGGTQGDVHFSFGTYPQTRVTDASLIEELNTALSSAERHNYGYTYGNNTVGSQVSSDLLEYADVVVNGSKYRAVIINGYRPFYGYYQSTAALSYQDENGYGPNATYWFRFDPIEWRLIDGSNLLLADLVLDAQAFNTQVFESESGKTINGKKYYTFSNSACTIPANEWSSSSIRRFLNNDFYNTAFSEYEQSLISESTLKNYGDLNHFNYSETVDKVFLLSRDDVVASPYYLSGGPASRLTTATAYAMAQGVSIDRGSGTNAACWMLRSAGLHSGDTSFVTTGGLMHSHMNPASTMRGVRPAIRIEDITRLISGSLQSPLSITASATSTGQITLKSAVCNGADGYRFYRYSVDDLGNISDDYDEMYFSEGPSRVINNLEPGTTYAFRAASIKGEGLDLEESYLSDAVTVLCRRFVTAPMNLRAEAANTGIIKVSFSTVYGAALYRVYRYIDSDTLILCGETDSNTCLIEGLYPTSTYYFKVSTVSDDGYESPLSEETVSAQCKSIPGVPQNVMAEATTTGCITVSWNAVEDAARYRVFQFISNTDFEEVGITEATSLDVCDLYSGSTYYFFVKAESQDGNKQSGQSSVVSAQCKSIPGVPQNVKAEATATGCITVSWDAVEDAARYRVFQFISDTDYDEVGITESTSLDVCDLYSGSTYYFFVKAESQDGNKQSGQSSVVSAQSRSIPDVPQNVMARGTATGCITVSWDAVAQASLYRIYKYASSTELVEIGVTDQLFFEDKNLYVGSTYYYRVAAENPKNSISAMSDTVNAQCESIPSAPQNLKAESAGGSVTLSWSSSTGAKYYNVFRYISNTETELVGTTSECTFTENNLSVGSYTYRINAQTADKKSTSSFSKVVTVSVESTGVQIISQPQNQVVDLGKTYSFTVEATGEGLSYTWYYKFPGDESFTKSSLTSSSYSNVGKINGSGMQMYCVVRDKYGNTKTSRTATLFVYGAPCQIVEQPKNQAVNLNATYTFTCGVAGEGLSYTWYYKFPGESGFTKSSCTTASYSNVGKINGSGMQMYCVVRDKYGNTKTSRTATLFVYGAPCQIVEQPQNAVVNLNERYDFTCGVAGEGLSYTWYYKFPGDESFTRSSLTSATYTNYGKINGSGMQMYCVVRDKYGNTKTSRTATLFVYGAPCQIVEQPQNAVVNLNENYSFTCGVAGEGLSYTWYYKFPGDESFTQSSLTSATYTNYGKINGSGMQMYCVVRDKYGNTKTSRTATLFVYGAPCQIVEQPKDQTVFLGDSYSITCGVAGEGLSYTWYYKFPQDSAFTASSVHSATYSNTAREGTDGLQLYCVVTDKHGNTKTSKTVTITVEELINII